MARSFVSASSQYLEIDQAAAATMPISLGTWVKWTNNAALQYCLCLHDKDQPDQGYRLGNNSGANAGEIIAVSYAGSTERADSTTAVSEGVWYHNLAVFNSSTSRAVYINGGSKGTDTAESSPTGMDRTSIGRAGDSTPGYNIDGSMAEAAIWTAALTDAEAAILALGVSPLLVRPASLAAYWPLIRTDRDRVGGYDLTAYNSPTWADHAPKIRPWWIRPATVRAAAPAISALLGQRGTLRGVFRGVGRGI